MRRRSLLRALGGTAALAAVGNATAHETATDTATPPDESAPNPLGSVPIEDAREAVADGAVVYVADDDGFLVVDVSDPGAPERAFETDAVWADHEDGPLRNVYDLSVERDRLLVVGPAHPGHESVHGAVLFDVSDPAAPERVAAHETDFPIHNCYLSAGLAYLTGNGAAGNPLVIVDVATGEVGRWSVFDHDDAWRDVPGQVRVLHDVWVREDLAYLAYWDAGTWILDVSDPSTPTFVSRVRGRSPGDLADVDGGREGLELPGNDHFVTVDPSGDLLGIGQEAWAADEESDRGPGGVDLYDVSDPADPTRLARIDPPPTPDPTRSGVWTTAHNFELTDGRCYSAWYQGGVRVFDLSEPSAPEEVYAWRDADRTQFWTAQRADGCFVAPSMLTPGEEDDPGGLYTFPDPPERTPTPTATPSPTTTTGDRTDVSGATGEGRPVALLGAGAALAGAWARLR